MPVAPLVHAVAIMPSPMMAMMVVVPMAPMSAVVMMPVPPMAMTAVPMPIANLLRLALWLGHTDLA